VAVVTHAVPHCVAPELHVEVHAPPLHVADPLGTAVHVVQLAPQWPMSPSAKQVESQA